MTNFAENPIMALAFNKTLKEEIPLILPFIQKLMEHQFPNEILLKRFQEMFSQNYECFTVSEGKEIVGVFGMWFMTRHYVGKSCEPDHIYISEDFRGKGVGKEIFRFIYKYAKEKDCENSELNSYVSNYRSHKFYLNEGYEIKGYHFIKKL